VHATRGVTTTNFHEVAIKQAAIAAALEKHLLVDATKFGRVAPAAFAGLDEFDTITVSPPPIPVRRSSGSGSACWSLEARTGGRKLQIPVPLVGARILARMASTTGRTLL
jgi:hypothetical protein